MGQRTRSDISRQLGIPVWQWVGLMWCGLLLKPFFFILASLILLRRGPEKRASKPTDVARQNPSRVSPANDPHVKIAALAQVPQ